MWLERGESGYWLRDAATGEALRWNDGPLRVVKFAGSSYRSDALQDDDQAVSLWEFRDEDGNRVGLRVLLAPADAWIQEPKT